MVTIIGVSGSKRANSTTLTLVKEMLKACEKLGAETQLIDLAEFDIPMFDHRKDGDYGQDIKNIQDTLAKADGFIIGTPEYHGSMSGALKNFLDHSDYMRVFAGKPAAFCGAGGGSRAKSALDHLLVVARALSMWAVPHVVGINKTDFDDNWQLNSPKVSERIETTTKALVTAASALRK